ncbi:MAG: hypothetical protein NVSMB19_15920 [Vulcanimicrobiaceae bacterium]
MRAFYSATPTPTDSADSEADRERGARPKGPSDPGFTVPWDAPDFEYQYWRDTRAFDRKRQREVLLLSLLTHLSKKMATIHAGKRWISGVTYEQMRPMLIGRDRLSWSQRTLEATMSRLKAKGQVIVTHSKRGAADFQVIRPSGYMRVGRNYREQRRRRRELAEARAELYADVPPAIRRDRPRWPAPVPDRALPIAPSEPYDPGSIAPFEPYDPGPIAPSEPYDPGPIAPNRAPQKVAEYIVLRNSVTPEYSVPPNSADEPAREGPVPGPGAVGSASGAGDGLERPRSTPQTPLERARIVAAGLASTGATLEAERRRLVAQDRERARVLRLAALRSRASPGDDPPAPWAIRPRDPPASDAPDTRAAPNRAGP